MQYLQLFSRCSCQSTKSCIYCFPGVLVKARNPVSTAVFQVFGQSTKSSIYSCFSGVLVKAWNPVFTAVFQVFGQSMTSLNTVPIFLGFAGEKARPQWTQLWSGICTFSVLCFLVLWSEHDFMVQHLEKSVSHTQMSVCAHNQSQTPCFMMFYSGLPVYSYLCCVGLLTCFLLLFCFFIVEFQQTKTHIFILCNYYEW